MSDDFRPAWLDYWNLHPHDARFPAYHPNWRPADNAHGVAFYAPWEEIYAGFPEHARRLAVALAQTSLPVHLRSLRGGMQFQTTRDHDQMKAFRAMRDALAPLLDASIKTYDVEVWMTIAESTAFYRIGGPTHHWMDADELRAVQKRRILSTVFERDRITDSDRAACNRLAQIWVATPRDAVMLREHGVEVPIHVIPIPFFPDEPMRQLAELPRRPGPITFYHLGKWEPRKNQDAIIGAFLCAFSPSDDVRLFVKTSERGPKLASGYPDSPAESIRRWAEHARVRERWDLGTINQRVRIIHTRLSERQVVQFHRSGDVYVTLSRGEGFDMPAYDAKLAGRRMIYTPSGGPQSFAAPNDLRVEATGHVPADPIYGWGDDAHYLDYDFEVAVARYREAAEGLVDAQIAPAALTHFSAERVGAAMRQAIEEVRSEA